MRDCIKQLKDARSKIQSTFINDLESVIDMQEDQQRALLLKTSEKDVRTADLEMAVLIQELMSIREERSDLRARVFLLEREKKSMELFINSQQAQESALKSHLLYLQTELERQEALVINKSTTYS